MRPNVYSLKMSNTDSNEFGACEEPQGIRENLSLSSEECSKLNNAPASCSQPEDESGFTNVVSPTPPDGGWGWIVTISAFLINIVLIGSHNCFGLLYLDLVNEFGESLSKTAWVGSIAFGSILLFAPLGGALSNKFGCRKVTVLGIVVASLCFFASSFVTSVDAMFVTYGLGFGFGTSLCYMQGAVVVSSYFSSRRALANGISLSGSVIGTMFIAPLYNSVNKQYGWRNAVRVLSGFAFLTLICAASYRPLQKPGSKPTSADEKIKSSPAREFVLDLSLWKNKAFVVWSVAVGLCKVGYLVPWVHMAKLSTDLQLSRDFGSQLLQYMSFAAGFSRLVAGRIADSPRINRLILSQFSACLMGIVNILQPSLNTQNGLIGYAITLGLLDGGVEILLPVMTLDIVGAEKLSVAWGCILAVISLSSMGPPIAGALRDSQGNYEAAFYLTGSTMILSAAVLFLIPLWAKKQPQLPAESFLSIHISEIDVATRNEQRQNRSSFVERYLTKRSSVPPRLFKGKSLSAACIGCVRGLFKLVVLNLTGVKTISTRELLELPNETLSRM